MNHPAPGEGLMRLVSSCPLCETRYSAAHARILSERNDIRLVHATCKKCGAATLALVRETQAGGSTVGLVTDLSHDDVLRFRQGVALHTDDVIGAHQAFSRPLAETLGVAFARPARRPRAKAKVKTRKTVRRG